MGPEERRLIPLSETLFGLVESLETPRGSGIEVTSAKIDVPLEGRVVLAHGVPVFHATLPHTRWRSGLLPPVHVAHLVIGEAWPEDEG
jgi:hypothetical protein